MKDLTPNAVFVETACFALILDSLSSEDIAEYVFHIRQGLKFLSKMTCQAAALQRIASIQAALIAIGLDSNPQIEPLDQTPWSMGFDVTHTFNDNDFPVQFRETVDHILSLSTIPILSDNFDISNTSEYTGYY